MNSLWKALIYARDVETENKILQGSTVAIQHRGETRLKDILGYETKRV